MFHYEVRFGSYYLVEPSKIDATGEHIILMTDEIAIAYSTDEPIWTIHKHGDLKSVQEWYDNTRSRLFKSNMSKLANSFEIISGNLPVEEVNKALDCTGYIKQLVLKCKNLVADDLI